MALERTVPAFAAVGAATGAYLGVRAWRSPQARFARMSGSSVVAPDGAAWVTDLLNAAYFRRRPELRQVDDLRLAFAVLTTRWHRLGHRRLRAPEQAPPTEQTWHTYPPVAVASAEAVVAAVTRPETWPDFATEIGRFTPVRAGGLDGHTFEIDVAAGAAAGRPIFTRGYVTITALVTSADEAALRAYVEELNAGLARFGRDEPQAVPDGATPVVGFDLTTHEGHFMGAGHNRLVLYEDDGQAYLRAAGTWDPMPWHIEQAYQRAGRDAQHAFWGQGAVETQSMLHQVARQVAGAAS